MMQEARVRFEPAGSEVFVPLGSTVLEAARAAGVAIDAACGGAGTCGSCKVRVAGAIAPPTRDERELLGDARIGAGVRLACRARIAGDVAVHVTEPAGKMRVVTAARHEPVEVERPTRGVERCDRAPAGVAADIGTTTLAVHLVDLGSGQVLAAAGALNAQRSFGSDVLARVARASQGDAEALRSVLTHQLEELMLHALDEAGSKREELAEAVAVGNVAMTGLLLGEDVSSLGEAPYEGAPLASAIVRGSDLGWRALPATTVFTPPAASAFIGSDVVAGLAATSFDEAAAPALYIDLGTNGEIVLAVGGQMRAASTAAGPALEGASIACGMRAEPGAVERVELSEEGLLLDVIGDGVARGVCGSGLVDLLAALLDSGVIDPTGRLVAPKSGPLKDRVSVSDNMRVFVLDETAGIVLTQRDVRDVQLAIGAVRAGIELLLAESGLEAVQVEKVVVAGGFGYHLRPAALARVGLLPEEWVDRVLFAGNAALDGARMMLVNRGARQRAARIAERIQTLDLATHPDFQRRFISALTFPD